MCSDGWESEMRDDIETLLARLRSSPTDLIRLVGHVLCRRPSVVCVSARAADAWQARDPEAWEIVCSWLRGQGVRLSRIH